MISKFLLLLIVLQVGVRTQGSEALGRNLPETNMMGGNQQGNLSALGSSVPSHNKPGTVIADIKQKQSHKNVAVGVVKENVQKNVTFVEGLSRNVSIKHVTVDQRSKTQIEQIPPSEYSRSDKIQGKAQQSIKSEITSPISKEVNNDQKDQKQFQKVKQQIQIAVQPSENNNKESKDTEKHKQKQSQQQTQIVNTIEKQAYKQQSPQQKRQTIDQTQTQMQHLDSNEQKSSIGKSQQKDMEQKSITDAELSLNKTTSSQISIEIIESVSQEQASESIQAINRNESVIKDTNSPAAVEIFKVLEEIKVQNTTLKPQQVIEKKQVEKVQVVTPIQKVEGQIKIIQMDDSEQDATEQQKVKVQPSLSVANPPIEQVNSQVKQVTKQNKQNKQQPTNILPQQKEQTVSKKQVVQQISNKITKQPQLPIIDEQDQVKVEIIDMDSQESSKQQIQQENVQRPQQNIEQQPKNRQHNSIPKIKDAQHFQQIINELYNEQKLSQTDINLSGSIQNTYSAPIIPKQDKYATQFQTIIPSVVIPHEEANKKQELQVLLTTVKENLQGKAKVDLIEHLQKEIKLTEQIKAFQAEKVQTKLSIHRQSQYANLKESEVIQKDLQLPPQQNMDAQTVIVIIVLTFIISIPIVKQIRQKPNKNEPQKRKQSTNSQIGYPQDNQSGFQVDQTFDQQYLGQVSKNPNERAEVDRSNDSFL